MAYVYMLTNDKGNVLYIGATDDLKARIYFHRGGFIPGFTKKYNIHKLVYFESHENMKSARERERQLKGKTRAKKNAIVESMNPSWVELSSKVT